MFEAKLEEKVEFLNLLRFRNWIRQDEVQTLYQEINRVVCSNGAEKNGPLISCNHMVRKNGECLELDFEFMVPIDKVIKVPPLFTYCESFTIENAMVFKIKSTQDELQKEIACVNQYIREMNLLPKTATYTVLINEDKFATECNIIMGV